ncbi:M50 family metallopeptidase [Aquibacillus koreensis]|uniref:M50 family metallopeptidase n=1 Tax=Aquibacillus koreensis TaxID=279446 RepID=UPI0023413040|nr:M50 family metallopeptidase [Aquibacillus koreensis]
MYIHPILWFFILVSVFTGTFMELSIILLIVLIHECGHYFAAKYYEWRIRRINLWIFGGVMETDEHASKPMKQELIVTLAGPLQHIWIYGLLFVCAEYSLLPFAVIDLALKYNTTILLFNLLPIWPLDGGKILLLLYSSFLPYRRALGTMLISSSIICMFTLLLISMNFSFTLSAFLLIGFILWENRLEWKRRYYTFIRFLLKRHVDKPSPKKIRPIVVDPDTSLMRIFSLFRRNYRHRIHVKCNGKQPVLLDEEACLRAYFKLKQYQTTAGEMIGNRD